MTVCSTAILSLQLTTISSSRFYSSLFEEWTATCQMNLAQVNVNLCPSPISFIVILVHVQCNTPLEGVTFQKYLGVYITSSHNCTKQDVEVKKKANKILGVLQRSSTSCSAVVKEQAYLSLVRTVCEYGSVAWSPYTQNGIICVESAL